MEGRRHLTGFAALRLTAADAAIREALKGDLAIVQRGSDGLAQAFTGVQLPGVLDALYAEGARTAALGATYAAGVPTLRLWAPTATTVDLLLSDDLFGTGNRRGWP
ncbi:hypothetical protein [Tessaracoccus coleopterorum]|uniref:hypothetical protein n=1 Tax=Tessaracoccus coleopterorum TaxID=2714950 RepID=UPI002F917893